MHVKNVKGVARIAKAASEHVVDVDQSWNDYSRVEGYNVMIDSLQPPATRAAAIDSIAEALDKAGYVITRYPWGVYAGKA